MFFTAIHQMMTESVDLTIVIRKTEPHRAADSYGNAAGT